MSNQQTTSPLWEQMHDAFMETADTDLPLESCIAAELRVVADAVVPEELEPPCGDNEPLPHAYYQAMSDAKWEQRQCIRQRLLDEAAKAEAGD